MPDSSAKLANEESQIKRFFDQYLNCFNLKKDYAQVLFKLAFPTKFSQNKFADTRSKMMDNKTIKGSCLCGEVHYQLTGEARVFQYCHCKRCRKITGSAHASNIITDPKNFKWTQGEASVGRYELPEAKHFAASFCTHCGSNLPWLTKSSLAVVIPAGTLDEDPKIRPQQNIYTSDKAPWHIETHELPRFSQGPGK